MPENETLYRNITDDDDEQRFECPENFVPVFSDQALASLNESFLREAEALCGNDVTCLFDTAATGQLAIGQSTLTESTELSNEISTLGKFVLFVYISCCILVCVFSCILITRSKGYSSFFTNEMFRTGHVFLFFYHLQFEICLIPNLY